jgi:hypothetical protein
MDGKTCSGRANILDEAHFDWHSAVTCVEVKEQIYQHILSYRKISVYKLAL